MASINLWVNEWTNEDMGCEIPHWNSFGYPPYLNNSDTDKIYAGAPDMCEGWFKFADVAAESVSAVVLWMEGYGGDQGLGGGYGSTKTRIYVIADGVPLTEVGEITPESPFAQWYNFDISSILDTPAKVNSAKIYVLTVNIGSPKQTTQYMQRCYLAVTYTPSAAAVPAGLSPNQAADILL